MTDEDLIEGLRKNALWVTTHDAADRIEQLAQESNRRLDLARSEGVARVIQFERAEAAEAKLAKAIEGLKFYTEKGDYEEQLIVRDCGCCSYTEDPIILDDKGNLARKVLIEMEKPE